MVHIMIKFNFCYNILGSFVITCITPNYSLLKCMVLLHFFIADIRRYHILFNCGDISNFQEHLSR